MGIDVDSNFENNHNNDSNENHNEELKAASDKSEIASEEFGDDLNSLGNEEPPPVPTYNSINEDSFAQWYFVIKEEKRGPISKAELGTLLLDGTITNLNLVWKKGFEAWVPIKEVAELSDLSSPSVSELAKKLGKAFVQQGHTLAEAVGKQSQNLLKSASENEILKDVAALSKSKASAANLSTQKLKTYVLVFFICIFIIALCIWAIRDSPTLSERLNKELVVILKEEGLDGMPVGQLSRLTDGIPMGKVSGLVQKAQKRFPPILNDAPIPKVEVSPESTPYISSKFNSYGQDMEDLMVSPFQLRIKLSVTLSKELRGFEVKDYLHANCYDNNNNLIEKLELQTFDLKSIPAHQETIVYAKLDTNLIEKVKRIVVFINEQD